MPGKFWPILRKEFKCGDLLMRLLIHDPATEWPPPGTIPPEMEQAFTLNGQCPLEKIYYFAQRYSSGEALMSKWSQQLIEEQMAKHKAGQPIGTYGLSADQCVAQALASYKEFIIGKVGLVVGSELPWVEAISLVYGAGRVHTLEYGTISTGHPQMKAFLPEQFALSILRHGEQYDFAFSYSSLEHSGLGRYGDMLNPFGDLEATSQIWCALKPRGILFVAVPVSEPRTWGKCGLVWNAHRHYGKPRFQHLTANFEQLGVICENDYQPIFILRKLEQV